MKRKIYHNFAAQKSWKLSFSIFDFKEIHEKVYDLFLGKIPEITL